MSTSNTRVNNCAQRMRPCALLVGVLAQSLVCAGAVAVSGTSAIAFRSFAFVDSTQ